MRPPTIARAPSTQASVAYDENRATTLRPTVPRTTYGTDSATATSPMSEAEPVEAYTTHMTASAYSRSPSMDRLCASHSTSTGRRRISRR
uniref:Uncharacterized protein n=1 Tax=Streptomyces sp. NBC_00003 TaxID=2903608 RepID=A0AAU2V575_9ACTN